MKKFIPLALIIIAIIAVSGCIGQNITGSGKIVNESRNVGSFNQIELNGAGELIITQGNRESLTVQADDNLMPYIKTSVNNNKLTINFDNALPLPRQPVKIYLTVRDINSINTSGSGKINSNSLRANNLAISMNGAGEGNLANLNTQTLKIVISGAGRMTISGNVNEQNIDISGAGEYNAANLNSKITTLSINGAGRGTVRVSDLLNAMINGGGEIKYIGNPRVVQQVNGAGNIEQIQG
ncbi:MAG: head GIN domain-containing protein [Methanobacterium sp.]|nr:head GIN domain-containing protein [Methanobacterium sp.]